MDLGQEFDSPHLHQLEKIDKSSAFAGLLFFRNMIKFNYIKTNINEYLIVSKGE